MSAPLQLGPPPRFQLPELGNGRASGGRFIRRAVSITLLLLALLVAAALIVAFTVRVDDTIRAPGVLEPGRIWPVRTLEAGAVSEVLVQTGDTVRRGQTVIRLDPLLLQATLRDLEASYQAADIGLRKTTTEVPQQVREQEQRLAQAGARVVSARAALRQRMVENDLGVNVDSLLAVYRVGNHIVLDLAVAEVRAAEAERRLAAEQMESLRLGTFDRDAARVTRQQLAGQIETVRERIRRLDIPAPTAGVILTEQIERLPGSSVQAGQLLLEMAESDEWRVVLLVREGDVHKVRIGDPVKAEIQAFRVDERDLLRGTVVHIAADPMAAQAQGEQAAPASAGTYRVIAALDPRQLSEIGIAKLRRGYTVDGRVVTRSGRIIDLIGDYFQEKFDFDWSF